MTSTSSVCFDNTGYSILSWPRRRSQSTTRAGEKQRRKRGLKNEKNQPSHGKKRVRIVWGTYSTLTVLHNPCQAPVFSRRFPSAFPVNTPSKYVSSHLFILMPFQDIHTYYALKISLFYSPKTSKISLLQRRMTLHQCH